jgi:hypothetical protein
MDYQVVLCSHLQSHIFSLLDHETKQALRGVSKDLRMETDRCFTMLDCPAESQQEIQRMQRLLAGLVSLSSISLRSEKAVKAVFSKGGTHRCGPRLEDVSINLWKVRVQLLLSPNACNTITGLTELFPCLSPMS